MASLQCIAAELGRIAVLYRHPVSEEEFPVLCRTWAGATASLADDDFRAACAEYLKRSRFFPCPSDVLTLHKALRYADCAAPEEAACAGEKRRAGTGIKHDRAAEKPLDRRRNAICAAMFRKSLAGNREARAFFQMRDWKRRESMARAVLGPEHPDAMMLT